LALHDENALCFQHATRFGGSLDVKFEHGIVPLFLEFGRTLPIAVVIAECVVRAGASQRFVLSKKALHVRWVKYDAVDAAAFVWQVAKVNACFEIRLSDAVLTFRHLSPENALAVRNIGDGRSFRDMEMQYLREHLGIVASVGTEYEIRRGLSIWGLPLPFPIRMDGFYEQQCLLYHSHLLQNRKAIPYEILFCRYFCEAVPSGDGLSRSAEPQSHPASGPFRAFPMPTVRWQSVAEPGLG